MKYLKLYEKHEEHSLEDAILYVGEKEEMISFLERRNINTLKGKIVFEKIKVMNLLENNIKSLDGIENYPNLERLWLNRNVLEDIQSIEKLKKLIYICVIENNLTSLKGLEKVQSLEDVACYGNHLENLDELENLPKLRRLMNYYYFVTYSQNPLEKPISYKLFNQLTERDIYSPENIEYLGSYKFQKEWLEEHPEKVMDLIPIGFDNKIKEEYKELIEFFNIKINI